MARTVVDTTLNQHTFIMQDKRRDMSQKTAKSVRFIDGEDCRSSCPPGCTGANMVTPRNWKMALDESPVHWNTPSKTTSSLPPSSPPSMPKRRRYLSNSAVEESLDQQNTVIEDKIRMSMNKTKSVRFIDDDFLLACNNDDERYLHDDVVCSAPPSSAGRSAPCTRTSRNWRTTIEYPTIYRNATSKTTISTPSSPPRMPKRRRSLDFTGSRRQ